jgi:hypothetical protein
VTDSHGIQPRLHGCYWQRLRGGGLATSLHLVLLATGGSVPSWFRAAHLFLFSLFYWLSLGWGWMEALNKSYIIYPAMMSVAFSYATFGASL